MATGKYQSNRSVLYISSIVALVFVAFGLLMPERMGVIVNAVFGYLTTNFGWFYLLSVSFLIVFIYGVAFSRFGKIKLGKDKDKPEFTNFQWFAMLFGSGMGIGLVFWSIAEPIMHYLAPPIGEGGTIEAMHEAMRITFFHWGIHPWALYAIFGVSLAYFQYRKGLPQLISAAFYPLIGDKIYGPIGKAVDILTVFAVFFAISTSLGLGSNQIATGIQYVWGVEATPVLTSVIIAVLTILVTFATISGLKKAMQVAANIKVWLAVAFMAFIFTFGGSVFILNIFTNSIGSYVQTIIGQSLWMGNVDWLGSWTVFYWAWWLAAAPAIGQFVARVSKGRTIRECVIAVTLLPVGFSFIWLAIYGGAAFNLDMLHNGVIQTAVNADYTTALFVTLQQLPLYQITAPLAILLIIVCFVALADSTTFTMAMLTSNGDENPDKKLRGFWGILQGAITIMLILVGGTASLQTLQTASIASAFPFLFIALLMCYSLYKELKQTTSTAETAETASECLCVEPTSAHDLD